MEFKKEGLRSEFWKLKSKAKLVMCYADWFSLSAFGKPLVVTHIYYEGGSGVHADWRGFDGRSKNYYTKEERELLKSAVNSRFIYDPKRPKKKTCLYHKVDIGKFIPEYHLHFQVWIE